MFAQPRFLPKSSVALDAEVRLQLIEAFFAISGWHEALEPRNLVPLRRERKTSARSHDSS